MYYYIHVAITRLLAIALRHYFVETDGEEMECAMDHCVNEETDGVELQSEADHSVSEELVEGSTEEDGAQSK